MNTNHKHTISKLVAAIVATSITIAGLATGPAGADTAPWVPPKVGLTPKLPKFDPRNIDQVQAAWEYIQNLDRTNKNIEWTGNTKTCDPGYTGNKTKQIYLDVLSYYREMAGLPRIYESPEVSAPVEAAVLYLEANDALNPFGFTHPHVIRRELKCATDTAAKGLHGNLGMAKDSSGNQGVLARLPQEFFVDLEHIRGELSPYKTAVGIGISANYVAETADGPPRTSKWEDRAVWANIPGDGGFFPANNPAGLGSVFYIHNNAALFDEAQLSVRMNGQAVPASAYGFTKSRIAMKFSFDRNAKLPLSANGLNVVSVTVTGIKSFGPGHIEVPSTYSYSFTVYDATARVPEVDSMETTVKQVGKSKVQTTVKVKTNSWFAGKKVSFNGGGSMTVPAKACTVKDCQFRFKFKSSKPVKPVMSWKAPSGKTESYKGETERVKTVVKVKKDGKGLKVKVSPGFKRTVTLYKWDGWNRTKVKTVKVSNKKTGTVRFKGLKPGYYNLVAKKTPRAAMGAVNYHLK